MMNATMPMSTASCSRKLSSRSHIPARPARRSPWVQIPLAFAREPPPPPPLRRLPPVRVAAVAALRLSGALVAGRAEQFLLAGALLAVGTHDLVYLRTVQHFLFEQLLGHDVEQVDVVRQHGLGALVGLVQNPPHF